MVKMSLHQNLIFFMFFAMPLCMSNKKLYILFLWLTYFLMAELFSSYG